MGGEMNISEVHQALQALQDGQSSTLVGGSVPNTAGTQFIPYIPYPNVCPSCGRCRDCGHPAPAPYYPPQPNFGYWPNKIISTSGDFTMASGMGGIHAQAVQNVQEDAHS